MVIVSIFCSAFQDTWLSRSPHPPHAFFWPDTLQGKTQIGMNAWSRSSLASSILSWGIQPHERPHRSGLPPVLWDAHEQAQSPSPAKIRHKITTRVSTTELWYPVNHSLHPTSSYYRQLHSYSKGSFYKPLNCTSCHPKSLSDESSQWTLLQNSATKGGMWGGRENRKKFRELTGN